ncbi:PAS domain S-box protein [bacterium]|nr:PAS domain S-box protein [bacterium]
MDPSISHRLLKRQVKKFLPQGIEEGCENYRDLLVSVNQAYIEFDADLKRTEHILEESSKELFKANKELQKVAEEKTREAAQMANRLKMVADSISEVIFQLDTEGNWTYLNKAWEKITGYTISESLGSRIFNYVFADDLQFIKESFAPVILGQKTSCQQIMRFVTRQNNIVWVQITARVISESDEIIGISGSISDITSNYLTQKENEKLALIVQKTRNVMVLTNAAGEITWVNQAFEKLTEYKLEEIKGKKPGSFLQGPNTSAETVKKIAEALSGKKSIYCEIINYSKSGREYWLELHIDPLLNEVGQLTGFIAVENEISDRKKQEQLIVESEAKLSAVINNIPDFIFYKNVSGNYELVNKAFAGFFNKTPEEIIGKSDRDIHSETVAQMVIDDDAQCLKSGKNTHIESEITGHEGEKMLLETTKSPLFDKNGKAKGLVGISRNVTEIKRAQQKIIESEERLKLATSSLSIGIFDWDIEANKLIWDASMYDLFEVKKEDFNGAYDAFEKCLVPDDLEKTNEAVQLSITQGKMLDASFRIKTKNGQPKIIKANAKVFCDSQGKPTRMVGLNYDITQQAEAEAKLIEYTSNLEKINAELDQFAYVVSHDLKAPLRAINNLSTWIEEDLEECMNEDLKGQFTLLRGRVLRMEGLINGILQYSRAGRIKTNNQQVDVNLLLTEMCDSLKTSDAITFELPHDIPTLYTEKVALEQVFANLVSNAIKYNDKAQTHIKIDYRYEEDKIIFSVADNGPGINKKYFDKIFVIFQTLQARDQFESTGVGLSIIKKIVEEKGGKIWLESVEKEGTTFYFSWPKTENAA